jgi:hypothetical protein
LLNKKIFFFQFHLPDFYPPLLNKMQVFETEGWEVHTGVWHTRTLVSLFESKFKHRTLFKIKDTTNRYQRGLRRLEYGGRMILHRLRHGPLVWCFTDSPSVGWGWLILLLDRKSKFIYIEYDSPTPLPTLRSKMTNFCRYQFCQKTHLNILPNFERAEKFKADISPHGPIHTVFNVPPLREISAYKNRNLEGKENLNIFYHGSFTESRLPLSLFEALQSSKHFHLTIRAVIPVPDNGFMKRVTDLITQLNVVKQVTFLAPCSWTGDPPVMIQEGMDIGLACYTNPGIDLNFSTMWGASNKVFQYMQAGIVPYIYTEESAFKEHLGDTAYFTESLDAKIIAASWNKITEQRKTLLTRKENVQKLVQNNYNFEQEFRPVIAAANNMLGQQNQNCPPPPALG